MYRLTSPPESASHMYRYILSLQTHICWYNKHASHYHDPIECVELPRFDVPPIIQGHRHTCMYLHLPFHFISFMFIQTPNPTLSTTLRWSYLFSSTRVPNLLLPSPPMRNPDVENRARAQTLVDKRKMLAVSFIPLPPFTWDPRAANTGLGMSFPGLD